MYYDTEKHAEPQSSSSTSVKTVTLSHKWVIEDFGDYCKAAGYASETPQGNREFKKIESARFRNAHFEMFLECYPYLVNNRRQDNVTPSHLAVDLCLVSSKLENTPFKYTISTVDEDRKIRNTSSRTQNQLQNNTFFAWNDLYDFRNANKLAIYCEVKYITTSTNPPFESSAPESNYFEKMANNFAELRKNEKFFDMTLLVRSKEFRVHKFLLCAHSPVFEAMFLKHENRVEITDVDSNVFETLLNFIYSGKIDCVKGREDELIAAADKYGLEQLKEVCSDELCKKLTPASVPDLLALADTYNATKLKQKALDFLQIHGQDTIQEMFANNKADQLISAFRNLATLRSNSSQSNRSGTNQNNCTKS